MADFFNSITGGDSVPHRNDDDVADRMTYRATVYLFVMLTIFVAVNPMIQDTISCWCPAHFIKPWVEYTNQYCWARSTYELPMDREVPRGEEIDQRHFLSYYQWVPYMLLALIASSLLPIGIWRSRNTKYGIDVNNVMESSEKITQVEHTDGKTVETYEAFVVTSFQRFFAFNRGRCKCSLTLLYAFVKILFIVTVILQMVALNSFLGGGFYWYGIDVMKALATSSDWPPLPTFPRVTMCDLNVRQLGSLQRYTVQCTLPANLYYEKIFFLVWVWLVLLFQAHIFRAIKWILNMMSLCKREAYIASLLQEPNDQLTRFVDGRLNLDGVFLLRLIEHNTDDLTIRRIVGHLWTAFQHENDDELPPQSPSQTTSTIAEDSNSRESDLDDDNIIAIKPSAPTES